MSARASPMRAEVAHCHPGEDRMKPAVAAVAVAAALLAGAGEAHAQKYPAKPVRLVVHIGPGSSMDIIARVLAQKLTERGGEQVIVDNRPGAGGNIGIDLVAKAPADGYTILFGSSSVAVSASYYRKLPYDALRDLVPVSQVSSRLNVLSVGNSLPVSSVKDLVAYAKARPGRVTFGSGGGAGSSDHMAGELFKLLAGVDIVHVPYRSGPSAVTDLINGQLTMYIGGMPVQLPMIKAGKIKPLATSGSKRASALPDLPTIAEAGVPGYEVNVWYGLFVPRGTPKAIVDRIAGDVAAVMKAPENHDRFVALGVDPEGTTPQAFDAYFRADIAKWRKVVQAAHLVSD
jgi:tripartite-type tricarboxylate transporter receptor subunit TctC